MNGDLAAIRQAIRDIPNFPKPGITFKDITPLLANGPLFGKTIDLLAIGTREKGSTLFSALNRVGLLSVRHWPINSRRGSAS